MIKCTFVDKQFKMHDRCTVCILKGEMNVPYPFLTDKDTKWLFHHPTVKARSLRTFTVTAKSIASEEDAYDETIGKRLAESRAKKRAYNFCHSLCKRVAENLNTALGSYAEAMEKFEAYRDKETEHQHEILAINESH